MISAIVLDIALVAPSLLVGFAYARITDRPREPETDVEHADLVHAKAGELNQAMHNARVAGLNPTITLAGIDDELPANRRPLILGVQRDGIAVPRTMREELVPPDLGCRRPPAGWYCSLKPNHEGACAARQR